MFRDLEAASEQCQQTKFTYDLKKAVDLAREHDEFSRDDADFAPRAMQPSGFVFHESRCGSTLAANALAAFDPIRNRVYSESPPPVSALQACGIPGTDLRCSLDQAAMLFQDVVYLMGRTDDPRERNLFFKIQSIGTRYLDVFLRAFPETPWIFVYRDPVQVIMSHFKDGIGHANCVRQLRDVPASKIEFMTSLGLDMRAIVPEEKCALHLVSDSIV